MRILAAVILTGIFAVLPAFAAEEPVKGVKQITATFEPAEAKPGQTVTLKLTVELAPGHQTYPTKQSDRNAAAMVNRITFPESAVLIFVGEVQDPDDPQIKSEPELGIKEMKLYKGTIVYERKAVVSPKAEPGEQSAKLKFRITVCDAHSCFPPKTVTPEAVVKVLPGPAVPVENAYKDEVNKALAANK
jgi:hypothetical protein